MDPVTAMATASAAFTTIKKGFAIGRDIESMVGDLSRWMGALSDIDQAEKEAKNPPIFKKILSRKSIEQEALEAFAAKKRAEQQRAELKQWMQYTIGSKAWDELIAMEGRIRKQRQETLYRQRERRQKFMEWVIIIISVIVGASLLIGIALIAKEARADEYITCRLQKCQKVNNMKACVYRGANNTQEVMYFSKGEWYPRQFQCKYKPNAEPPATIEETLKAIKESQK